MPSAYCTTAAIVSEPFELPCTCTYTVHEAGTYFYILTILTYNELERTHSRQHLGVVSRRDRTKANFVVLVALSLSSVLK